MAELPRAVLSVHFQERMSGRRLRSAVFLTYQFDPGFFEQEVLPVFLDVSLSVEAMGERALPPVLVLISNGAG
jgi:hypothetical protein